MNRRICFQSLAAMMVVSALPRLHAAPFNHISVDIGIDSHRAGKRIPLDFMGLGHEVSSVASKGLLHPDNNAYIQMLRMLSRPEASYA